MADTKIGDLPTDVTALADGDKFPVADASAATANTYATALEVKTYKNTAPVFAAGSASANTWPRFTSGTVLTTPEDGAIELDADCFYGCTDAGNRGYIPIRHYIRQDASRTPTGTAATMEKIFNSVTNGRITLETGAYLFRMMLYLTGMSSSNADNLQINLNNGGSGTFGSFLWHAIGIDQANPATTGARTGTFSTTSTSASSAVLGNTAGGVAIQCKGTFECTSAGTMIPSFAFATTDATSTLAAGSYLMLERMGSSSVVSIGQWD